MSSQMQLPNLLSCIYLPKNRFLSQYCMFQGKTEAKQLYQLVLTELKKAVSAGDMKAFKKFCTFIECIHYVEIKTTLEDFFRDISNPMKGTNFVILACKHDSVEILEYIFSHFKIFTNLSVENVVPSVSDENCHNCFYYAIRSGNVELLEKLINGWRGNYFELHSTEFDDILSKSYEELQLKNVLLKNEMELIVEHKLINLRFFSTTSQDLTTEDNVKILHKRIHLILENIGLLVAEYYSNSKEVDGRFIYIATFVVKNIHMSKRLLRSTYDKLPWEEIEFCSVCFIASHVKKQELNLISNFLLPKRRMLDHLKYFAQTLKDIFEGMKSFEFTKLPRLQRGQVIQEIVKSHPEFKGLYSDYKEIRDIHTLDTMSDYINRVIEADLQNRESQIAIARVLQVIGEYIKNTLESPKLSGDTSDLLLLSLPKHLREIIINIRNSLSHAESLVKRMEIESNMNAKFLIGIQSDLKNIGDVISDILSRNKLKIIIMFLKRIISCKSVDELNEARKILSNTQLNGLVSTNLKTSDKLENLVRKLSNYMIENSHVEVKVFEKILDIIKLSKAMFRCPETEIMIERHLHSCTYSGVKIIIDDSDIRYAKFIAERALIKILEIAPDNMKEIYDLLRIVFKNIGSKILHNVEEIFKIVVEICSIVEFKTGDIKWIEELREKLNDTPRARSRKTFIRSEEIYWQQLELKRCELENILKDASNNPITTETISCFKANKKLQAAVEMIVLDIMSILDNNPDPLKCLLENNHDCFDYPIPLLIGKCLRNHLAHGNEIVGLLFPDISAILFLNAKKLSEESTIQCDKKIGKLLKNHSVNLEICFRKRLLTIFNQENMFVSVEKGNLNDFKYFLKKGADINARNTQLWTSLHLAAKGAPLCVINFILKDYSNVKIININGENPLHIAAAFGQTHIVEFLMTETCLSVNDSDNKGRTSLHIAAKNGHKETTEMLLKQEANAYTQDAGGRLALHYAICNGHIDIVKLFLENDKYFDVNENTANYTPLHVAAEFGHLEIVDFFIQSGANVNVKNDMNWTPLHAAALNGHLEVVKSLILKDADIDAQVKTGYTPLYFAVENDNKNVVDILLELGANVNLCNKTNNITPLHFSSKMGYGKIVKDLLKHKANAKAVTVKGITPMHVAAHGGHEQIVIDLLEYGAVVNARDENSLTPLHFASKNGQTAIVKLLIEKYALINEKDFNGATPLYYAASENHLGVVEYLIANKCDVSMTSKDGLSPLHSAAAHNNINIIDLLVKGKADVNAKDSFGVTPLHTAVLAGKSEAVNLLIKYEALVNIRNSVNLTPLHAAAYKGHKDILEILIKNESEINAKCIFDNTPLHAAVQSGCKETVKILLENRADVNSMNNIKATPLLLAVQHNYKDIVDILISNRADINVGGCKAIFIAVTAGYISIVKSLLKNKAEINAKYDENATLLHLAVEGGHTEIAKCLIKEGCAIDAKHINGVTPLWIAAQEGNEEIVDLLIANGASVNVKCNKNITPLHRAAYENSTNVIDKLLANKAHTDIKDHKERTPLELAVAKGHLDIVKMLMRDSVDIDYRCKDDWTLLHIAAQENYLEIIRYLVNKGFNINSKNIFGSKPIHIAAREGSKDALEFFLSKGSDINERGKEGQTLLHYGIIKGHLEIVKYLIEQGACINIKDVNHMTPLHFAAMFGYSDIVKYLLNNGAIYNVLNRFRQNPSYFCKKEVILQLLSSTKELFDALKHNSLCEVEKCITRASVTATNTKGGSPLHYATWKGSIEIVNMLLKSGAKHNAIDKRKYTPLHYAVKFSHVKAVNALLCNGAMYNAVSESGKTPIDFSTNKQITILLELVLKSFKNVKSGNIEFINKLKDIDIVKAIMNAQNEDNRSLIVTAILNNFPKVEELKNILQCNVSSKVNSALHFCGMDRFEEALCILNAILEERKKILGADNPGTLDIQEHIAAVLYKRGNYKDALNLFEDILHKQENLFGHNCTDNLKTSSAIALTLHRLHRNKDSFEIFQKTYLKQKEILGPNHADTLSTHFHMALVLDSLGKYEEALRINKEILKIRIDSNDLVAAVHAEHNIGMVLLNQGKYREALEVYNAVLVSKQILFGLKHSDTLRTLDHIALLLYKEKSYREAFSVYKDLCHTQMQVLGPNHRDTLYSQYHMANVLLKQCKWMDALKLFKTIYPRFQSVWGVNNDFSSIISNFIDKIYFRLKLSGNDESDINQYLQTDMNCAADSGDTQSIEHLLKMGADVNEIDSDGRSPLHYAVDKGHLHVVNVLLENGGDATQVTNNGNTPLHIAVSKGFIEIAKTLVKHVSRCKLNSFINAQTFKGGNTALHVAAKNSSMDMVIALLEYGASHDIKNNNGKIPLEVSKNHIVNNLLNEFE